MQPANGDDPIDAHEDEEDQPNMDPEDDEGSEDSYQPAVPDEEKTPITIVTGFLGAGKTTLVNHILTEQREFRIIVIENEVGAVSIDNALVTANMRAGEEIITLDNGCACCTVRGDLLKALHGLLERRKEFDCVLLETTGLADPSPIVATFEADPDIKDHYRIDSMLCLVDAKHIGTQLDRKPADGSVNEAVQQLAFADRVLVNKTDLVSKEELQGVVERIRTVNAFAEVIETQQSRAPLAKILGLGSFNLDRTLELLEGEMKAEEAATAAAAAAAAAANGKGSSSTANGGSSGSSGNHGHHGHEHGASCGADCSHHHDQPHGDHGAACGPGCSHDHSHSHGGEHNHEGHKHEEGHSHSHDGNGHGHGAAEADGHGKRGSGDAAGAAAPAPAKRARVVSTRHDSRVGSLGLTMPGSFVVDKFNDFMGDLLEESAEDLYRYKGVLSFDQQLPKIVFQGVHEQVNCEPSSHDWAEGEERVNRLVFIGRDLNQEKIEAGLKACLA